MFLLRSLTFSSIFTGKVKQKGREIVCQTRCGVIHFTPINGMGLHDKHGERHTFEY